MASLLALVADLLATSGLLGAVTGVVTRLAAVIALHAVDTFARHVSITTARVAGLSRATTEAATTAVGVTVRRLIAVPSDVADLTTLVALSGLATAAATANGAFARNVAGLTTLVAGLVVLHGLGAITAHMALATTVIALGGSLGRAIASLVAGGAARITGASRSVIHYEIACVLLEEFFEVGY